MNSDELGLKILTTENFLQEDPVVSHLVQIDRTNGEISPTTPQFWAEAALSLKLSSEVPLDVRRQFEALRGLLVYGYFFYPLFTLASELSMRLAESAIKHKCAQLNGPERQDFEDRINWLFKEGHMNSEQRDLWHIIRQQRNDVLHSDKQMILPPAMSIPLLDRMTEYIDELFVRPKDSDNQSRQTGVAS